MKGAFSYDSPMMQILMYIGDLIILNFIFLLCCMPIFTIGAAQAGLYTAIKVLNDKEDDSSATSAFFRGFKAGFLQVTIAWVILFVALILMSLAAIMAFANGSPGWLCVLPLVIIALFLATVPAFHSRFGCTAMQLIRNCWFLIFAHLLRCAVAAALILAPIIVFLFNAYYFMMMTPIWCTIYFSTAVLFGELMFRKPFKVLIEEFNRRQEAAKANDPNALPEPEKENKAVFSDVTE